VELSIRDTKRFIFFFESRGVSVFCDRADFFIDYTGLGGRGELVVLGNGGSISDCSNSAIRSQRKTSVSSVRFLRNRALRSGSAIRVAALDDLTELVVDGCVFEDQLQRPIEAPSNADHEGGGAVWATGVSEVRLVDNTFTGNEASQGGAVYLANCMLVFIKGCVFERNWALLDSVGGGGAAILMTSSTSNNDEEEKVSFVTVVDSVFVGNQAGGAGAGLYVGGLVRLNLTRVVLANNTSLATSVASSHSLRQASGGGVGLLVFGSVMGLAINVSMEANGLLNEPRLVPRNVACAGAFLRNNCVLLWNQACDLCRRKLLGFELALRSQPCDTSSQFVWRVDTILFLVGGIVLALVLAGGGVLTVLLLRRYRRQQLEQQRQQLDGLHDLQPDDGELLRNGVEMNAMPKGKEDISASSADYDDDDFDEMEPPGYGVRSPNGNGPVGYGRSNGRSNGGGAMGSSEELLPSVDFARRASPIQLSSFKEIAYDELELDPEPIGSGAFGLVYRATWRGSVVAVKKYIGSLDAEGVANFRAEAQLLHAIGNHPNVIKLFGACTVGPNYCLVVPYYQRGSVRDYFRVMPKEERTWSFVASVALQIAAGMMHLHKVCSVCTEC
jgi:hypothetical protein